MHQPGTQEYYRAKAAQPPAAEVKEAKLGGPPWWSAVTEISVPK